MAAKCTCEHNFISFSLICSSRCTAGGGVMSQPVWDSMGFTFFWLLLSNPTAACLSCQPIRQAQYLPGLGL